MSRAADEVLPLDVQKLLLDTVTSFDDLAVLLWLRSYPSRGWDAASIAEQVAIDPEAAQAALQALRRDGLVEVRDDLYLWRPDRALAQTVARLAEIYEERPLGVIQRMAANSIERVRRATAQRFAGRHRDTPDDGGR